MKLLRFGLLGLSSALVSVLIGCAHPINLEPVKLPQREESKLVAKTVAYVLTDADRAKQVITPGGGGDKVSYFPYRDMEKAIRTALRSVYRDVSALKSATDTAAIKDSGASYIFAPEIATSSSSASLFTWPPTNFTAEISCTVTDPQGAILAGVRASGNGVAEFSEFKSDCSLAARRAVSEAVENLAREIGQSEKLR